jgi:alpha-2-macroglobulin
MKKIYQSNRRLIISLIVLLIALSLPALWLWQQQPDLDDFSTPRLDEGQTTTGVGRGDPFLAEMGIVEEREGSATLRFRLSQGEAQFRPAIALAPTVGIPLSDAETAALLARLPALETDPDDWADFRLPPETLPAPRPGETVDQPFPPPPPEVAPPEVPEGPLEVLRFAPEGEIPVAPFLSLTFNQPMVPLATLADLDMRDVPVSLAPELPGRWQWLGTQTLIFEYEGDAGDRFPMATEYVATVPAGTESMTGGALAQDVTWRFRTPPAAATRFYPQHGPQPLEPLFYVALNQAVEPEAALSAVSLTANGRSFSLRLATESEIEADETVNRMVANERDRHAFVFRASEPLPAATSFTVTVGPNLPSAEGPLTSNESQTYTFETYAPLRVTDHRCGWNNECPPLNPFWIEFNNPLDPEAFEEEMVRISPAVDGAAVRLQGNSLSIQGLTQGRTTYRVTLSADLPDRFGQTLVSEQSLTFRVGQAPYLLSGPDQPFVTLDPAAPELSIYTINHERLNLRVYRVTPGDWSGYQTFQRERYRDDPPPPPGELVQERTLTIEGEADALTETNIDLSDALENNLGQLVVVIEPPSGIIERIRNQYGRQSIIAWVQATQIGLDAISDGQQLSVWANDLATGAPLAGVAIELWPNGESTNTGSDGLAQLAMPTTSTPLLLARQGDDLALLPHPNAYWGNQGWESTSRPNEMGWYVFDDRAIYRPGEDVFIKGWLRQIDRSPTGDVSLLNQNLSLNYTLSDARGNEIERGQVTLNEMGGFDLRFSLPDNINLGDTYLNLSVSSSLSNSSYTHYFQVQEFRTPEFEVTARNESTGPYFVGDSATVAVQAEYFAGGALPNADVEWRVTATPGHYAPPNWPDFTFGTWTPWWPWGRFDHHMEMMWPMPEEPAAVEHFSGVTDATGNHYLQLDFEEMVGIRPFTLQAEATVFDVNRQAWTARTSLLVHPADLYVGLRGGRTFVPQGQPLEIEAIVTDLDGTAVANQPITIEASQNEWRFENGRWQDVPVASQTCEVNSATEPVSCTFDTQRGGTYEITATISDERGRANQSQLTRWVSGGQRPTARTVEQETVTLIPDREEYQPGDTAQILVQSPFGPAEGLLTVSRDGLLRQERFRIDGPDHTLSIPIVEDHLPNLHVRVDLVGNAARTDDDGQPVEGVPDRPAYATGSLNLSIPPHSRTLNVEAILEESALAPGGSTTLNVTVRDANGQPVPNAELAAVVVDEAVLSLTGYRLRNPLDVFYRERPSLIDSYHSRASILLINPLALQQAVEVEVSRLTAADAVDGEMMVMEEAPMAAPAMEMDEAEAVDDGADPITIRQDFNPLATFAPAVRTDGSGQAQVAIQLPDNLTRYRVMVVAVTDRQFGTAESNLTARLPLMVRPSAPRFLNFGDRFELPIVVQNQTNDSLTVDVALRVSNLELLGSAGQQVTVPANDRVEVRFPARAEQPGTARFQVAVSAADYADAASGEWPVYTPATTEAFATYGVLDGGAVAQPVQPPTDVFPQFGGLEIGTSSTAVQALTDAVLYLHEYPYDSAEPLASRIMAVAALRDVLEAFSAEGLPQPAELEQAVQRDIEQLQGLQNEDGGFPVWERHRESWPFHTIYATHALHVAQGKGFTISADGQQRALNYLRQIEQYYPDYYSPEIERTLSAYALYVRDLLDDRDVAKSQSLLNEAGLENLSLEAVAWLWPTLADQPVSDDILRLLNNRAVETAAAANFITGYSENDYLLLHSNRRSDAVILDALIDQRPESDLIPKVVNGLLAHRERGRWGNTQENTFVLLALDRYFRTFESVTPDFVARFWLGDEYVAEHTYVGRTTERNETLVPMAFLVDSEMADLIVGMEGDGRLYYRLGMSYAPTDLQLPPLDRGFVVQRTYEAVDDPDDVYQDEEGVWHIRAGARVRVEIQMVATSRRYHVALVDPLPAGLEIINPDLAVTESIPADPTENRIFWWWGPWYEHQNLRDARAEAFTTLLWDGVYSYSYVARATTPGTFIVPPAKAEEMYTPEVFGRSGSDLVIVE